MWGESGTGDERLATDGTAAPSTGRRLLRVAARGRRAGIRFLVVDFSAEIGQSSRNGQILQLSFLYLSFELLDVLRADLHEEYTVDEVEHVDDGGHAGRLDVQRRVVRVVRGARVRLRQPLLQHHRLLRQVTETLRRLARLLVLLAQLHNTV